MSLNEINLSPYLVTQLYSSTLVGETKKAEAKAETETKIASIPEKEPVAATSWKFLGNNQKKVLVAVNYTNLTHLPDPQLDFLTQLLKACQLGLNDVVIININNYTGVRYTEILDHFGAQNVLLFGITVQEFGFPFGAPPYQVQAFDNRTIIHAPSLQDLQNDKPAKSLLWAGLKKIFNI